MNWAKENKFLTGFIAVMLIGFGVLGYFVYSASSAFDEASDGYTKVSSEYNRLRHLVPFPNKQNLQAYEAQKDDAGKVITAFESDLSKKEFPLDSISPEKFQDQLKASVTAVRAKAAENGIKLPDKFYLGFAKYETTPPSNEAAAPLSRELKAIEWVLNQYLSHPATQLRDVVALDRTDLPEEKGARGATAGGRTGSGGGFGGGSSPSGRGGGPGAGGPGGGSSGRRGLVQYHPFDVTVICKQQALIEVLKTITGAEAPQFYVLRQIRIKNEKDKGPPRNTPDAAKPDEKQTVQYIVGEEWLDVVARWEVIDFASPADKKAPDESPPPPKPGLGSKSTSAPAAVPAPAATLTPAAIVAPATTLTPAPAAAPASTAAPATAATPVPQSTPASQKP